MSYATFTPIEVTKAHVLGCAYSQWYPKLKAHAVKSIILKPLPQEFLDYLASDSIKLENEAHGVENNSDNEYSDWEDDLDGEDDGETAPTVTIDQLQALHDQIKAGIDKLGGAVTPKLNWSAPKDARWIMAGNTTRCTSPNDVYLLLNASDHVVDDLDYPFSSVEEAGKSSQGVEDGTDKVEYELVLRKWMDINPALEFRVFVKDNRVLGISQRDLNHYVFLEALQDELKQVIEDFIYSQVVGQLGQSQYIVDVYVSRPSNKVYVVDVNPFSRKCDSLLYTWNELLVGVAPELRLITETNVGRFAQKEYSESQVPLDVVDAAGNSEAMVELAREWAKLQAK
ncbi:D123-domain-containing protein [Suhomyces tanzawaensis NRRL Y-17324]|uniref:D123-domain-containing protein n=1 Tax=Suhomyces tanzawaensis NRRL Y-17324 TaxID=984487 RepID=A0A1E4SHL6_9ASCO|nr:D123-domain-containing protein [Suhomyces tanzawaensis NRRL Y-17324]ODV78975.1 D123-domain-containing protein [Suhomyces tanzawaensis NRRL Y-17324]